MERFSRGGTQLGCSHPLSVALGDANGDGKPDLLVANNECAVAAVTERHGGVLLGTGRNLSDGSDLRLGRTLRWFDCCR